MQPNIKIEGQVEAQQNPPVKKNRHQRRADAARARQQPKKAPRR